LRTQPAFLKHALSAVPVLAVVGGVWSAGQARRSSQEIPRSGPGKQHLKNRYPSYRALLQDGHGSEVWTLNKSSAQGSETNPVVVLTLPTKLPPDDYAVKLSGMNSQGDFDDIGKYYFRVPRK